MPTAIICGMRAKYQRGCRCSTCTKANADYTRKYKGLEAKPICKIHADKDDCTHICNGGNNNKVNVSEQERAAWRAADIERMNPGNRYTTKDEEIWEVMREDISRGNGYRRFMGRWMSNDTGDTPGSLPSGPGRPRKDNI